MSIVIKFTLKVEKKAAEIKAKAAERGVIPEDAGVSKTVGSGNVKSRGFGTGAGACPSPSFLVLVLVLMTM